MRRARKLDVGSVVVGIMARHRVSVVAPRIEVDANHIGWGEPKECGIGNYA
jgi:hypothetical protein